MSVLQHLPLGRRVPDKLHAVSCNFPTLEDLCGYEERRPETMARMSSGYPRFVVHPLVRRLAEVLEKRLGLSGRRLWLCCSGKAARELVDYLAQPATIGVFCAEGIHCVSHPEDAELTQRAKQFLQHSGRFLAAREAEDVLVRLGELPAVEPEPLFEGDAAAECWRTIANLFPGVGRENAFLVSAGMNAVYSAFRAVEAVQRPRGRDLWVQLGWLYVDSIAIMRKFSAGPDSHLKVRRVDDVAALERLFEEQGARIAGVIAEVPTNPLIQTADVARLRALADEHGAMLVLDPSVVSFFSVNLLPFADIHVTSLTKYAAHEGDVIAGLAVVNPARPDAAALRAALERVHEPAYGRDLARLALQLPTAAAATRRMEATLREVVAFLAGRPEVGRIHWARAAGYAEAFARVARSRESCGGMLSFELKGVPMRAFHDHIRMAKGPSFGMADSLLTPFIWLAHYDLVTTEAGRAELAANDIDPDLIRLAVGLEPASDIIAALGEALDAARAAACEGLR